LIYFVFISVIFRGFAPSCLGRGFAFFATAKSSVRAFYKPARFTSFNLLKAHTLLVVYKWA